MQMTVATPGFRAHCVRKRERVTIFYSNLLEVSSFLNWNLEEVLKHSYGFNIKDISSSNRMTHCGLPYSFPGSVHCHCVIEKRPASNYNKTRICSQCFLWLMCAGCGHSFNRVQIAPVEMLLIHSAWQTRTSTIAIGVLAVGCHRSTRN